MRLTTTQSSWSSSITGPGDCPLTSIIFLGTPINDDAANLVIAQLLFLEAEDP